MTSATKFASYLKRGWYNFFSGEYSTTLPVLADGERAVAQMDAGGRLLVSGKRHREIVVAPAVTAGAYGANDVIGGKLTFANALRAPSLSGKLISVHVNCTTAAVLANLKLGLFKADPAASTFTDNDAPALAAADFDKLIGIFALGGVGTVMGTPEICQLDNINKAIQAAGTSLYGVLVTSGTPTLGSTAAIKVAIGVEQD